MRILVINNIWPHPNHDQAANVIMYEMVVELSRRTDAKVGFLKINHYEGGVPSTDDQLGIIALKNAGVEILEPLNLPQNRKKSMKWRKLLKPRMVDFCPEVIHKNVIEQTILKFVPDVLLIPVSEWVTSICADIRILKFAYYGNPVPKSAYARMLFEYNHGYMSRIRFLLKKKILKKFEKLHISEMKKYDILGNVSANDAQYYIDNGHPNASYIQNIWIDRYDSPLVKEISKCKISKPLVIVGNVGLLSGTANTHGLEILGRDVLPELQRTMKGISYEVHLFGKGSLYPSVAKYLNSSEVKIRGFVPDIDSEMSSSGIFLCANNASDYKVGHTRYLHAWSLGCCVIAHVDCALSMPEIVHGKNALLGRNPAEMADLVAEAVSNHSLRVRIGEGGYMTFKNNFTATKVVPKIFEKIKLCLSK